jgi:hypothetical protein
MTEGSRAYLVSPRGLDVIRLDDPARPQVVSTLPWNGGALAAAGNLLFATTNGLEIIDITDPTSPILRGRCSLTGEVSRVFVSGTKAYLATVPYVAVVDVGNPDAPRWLGSAWVGDMIGASGDYVYGSPGGVEALAVYNFSDPLNGACEGVLVWDAYVQAVLVSEGRAFLLDCYGVHVFDLKDLCCGWRSPPQMGAAEVPYATKLAVSGDRLYVVGADPDVWKGGELIVFGMLAPPAITGIGRVEEGLRFQWNTAAEGMALQRATSLTSPDWQTLPGSEFTNRVTVQMCSGSEFFRLVKP